ncbi:MAG: ribosome biogenesis GTP-binding protein YihA/YsxC [Thermodesulfobacteriota bacterium]|nr:ribosome biogenesis GTP-binding protein YihA/YsxC [Thermodesulfobacteriota bacterium]
MKIKSAEFVKSAVKPSQYPSANFSEIAFSGRSNVGKSSLINTLLNRKRLVKTSSTPGRTQLINFFLINSAFCFVDLPGYGYARVPASVQKKWGPMIETYLLIRDTLKGVVLIMDIRRTPGIEELELIAWFSHFEIPSILVLTKTDKLSKTKQIKQKIIIAETFNVNKDNLILFSARTGRGKKDVWDAVEKLMGIEELKKNEHRTD